MPFTQSAERAIHYIQMPSERGAQAEHVVLIHGLATSLAFWYLQIAPALAKYFNVLLYDLSGHGRSRMPKSGYTPREMADDLRDLMDHLNIEKAHVIAHSFGGLVALQFARHYRPRLITLTIADSQLYSLRARKQPWEHGRKIQAVLRKSGLDVDVGDPFFGYRMLKEAARMQVDDQHADVEALREWVHPFIGKAGKRGARQWLKLLDTTEAEREIMTNDGISDEVLAELDLPTLAVYGEISQALTSGRRLVELMPQAQLTVVPGAGHFFPASRPKMLIGAWSSFTRVGDEHA
ncbi:alpha/beta hydrolase [Mangrovimicrobium sediminis]|uniref:Alpha/beta hydrolase n=1 Tax=Mangrovimicrobium sediminis TaxID=2562682 RepID=A0A4Z0M984_9GAMM|nr:alpha/beta hydrolase [Haliea sp. SAOS-164]TGD76091.1 alpha/beta hydrolase [Haliea sp. SAOS-164]